MRKWEGGRGQGEKREKRREKEGWVKSLQGPISTSDWVW
jgi:hypothetical protein